MAKRSWTKATALLLCLVFLSLAVPNLIGADRRTPRFDVRILWEKPLSFLASIFPFLGIDHHKNTVIRNSSDSSRVVMPTGDLNSGKPSDGK
jgi:hypothetical protein